ncbi:hypothetical protein GCM10018791_67630 [Streptomyces zaomyceticus]|nr:hypothetical protein GCM10018791_67630 [Streptomyces zaomyceticus]
MSSASSRTAAYDPANPIPAMIRAPAMTRPMSIRCVRVSCIAATRDPPVIRHLARTDWHMHTEPGPRGRDGLRIGVLFRAGL